MREAIRSVVPKGAAEVISYGMLAFKHDRVLVWFAASANHVSLFPGGSVLHAFKSELTTFKTSKGTVQFPLDRRLPIPRIKRSLKARIDEVECKKQR